MIGAIYLSVKQSEWDGLLPPLVALLGIFILDLLAALGIAVLMGYVVPPWFVSRLASKPDISLTVLSLLCTHVIAFAAWDRGLHFVGESHDGCGASAHTMSKTYSSYHLLKQGKSHDRNNDPPLT